MSSRLLLCVLNAYKTIYEKISHILLLIFIYKPSNIIIIIAQNIFHAKLLHKKYFAL